MKKIWKDVIGYEGLYQVSDHGKVLSLPRKHQLKTIILANRLTGREGRERNIVFLSKNGKSKNYKVSRLVYQAFIGELIDGLVIDHIDNNPLNDHVNNLQQITHRENISKDRTGTSKYTGVSWCNVKNKWRSVIVINKKQKHIGYYVAEVAANFAYKRELKKIL